MTSSKPNLHSFEPRSINQNPLFRRKILPPSVCQILRVRPRANAEIIKSKKRKRKKKKKKTWLRYLGLGSRTIYTSNKPNCALHNCGHSQREDIRFGGRPRERGNVDFSNESWHRNPFRFGFVNRAHLLAGIGHVRCLDQSRRCLQTILLPHCPQSRRETVPKLLLFSETSKSNKIRMKLSNNVASETDNKIHGDLKL